MFDITRGESAVTLQMSYGKVNAMDIEFCQAIHAELSKLGQDDQCKAVVIRGSGKVFSAGIDLKRWLVEPADYVAPFIDELERLFQTVFCFDKPVVAAINGHAIAGGCMLAGACDFRVIERQAKIGIPEMRVGVPLPTTAIEIMRFKAKSSAFESVISGGATFVGPEAVEVGLADVSCESTHLNAEVAAAIERLCCIPQQTFSLTKRQARNPVMRIIRESTSELREEFLSIWCSPETRASVQSYVDERLS